MSVTGSNDDERIARITPDLLNKAEKLSERRNRKKNGAGRHSVNKNPTRDHRLGALGELIAAKWLDSDVDWRSLDGGDDGVDLVIEHDDGETTVDVKTTKYRTGRLLISEEEVQKAQSNDDKQLPDAYLLVRQVDDDAVELAGWIPSTEAIQKHHLKPKLASGATGKNYQIEPDLLYQVPEPKGDVVLESETTSGLPIPA